MTQKAEGDGWAILARCAVALAMYFLGRIVMPDLPEDCTLIASLIVALMVVSAFDWLKSRARRQHERRIDIGGLH